MQIFIPVTRVSHPEIKQVKSMHRQIHPQARICSKSLNLQPTSQIKSEDDKIDLNCQFANKNQKQQETLHFYDIAPFTETKTSQKAQNREAIFHSNLHSEKAISQELQKKSTKSSLYQSCDHQQIHSQNQEVSVSQLNQKSLSSKTRKNVCQESHLQTEGDILPQQILSCKICLQTNDEPSYNPIINPICKVCKCKDYVHLNCLEEWITRRDILNEEIHPDQCEVCLAVYDIEMYVESFVSLEILRKNFRLQPYSILCKVLPPLGFLLLSIFGLYLFGDLIAEHQSDGGEIRQLLSMPYGTCITIVVFLLLIFLLVFGIFLYTWIMEFCLDFKYKIRALSGQKPQTNKLRHIFSQIR